MGKRSNFKRNPRDFYPTPYKALEPLLPHLDTSIPFVEPCAGNGVLISYLKRNGHDCYYASDIEPAKDIIGGEIIHERDAITTRWEAIAPKLFITNPPWARDILHPLIECLRVAAPTWLLFDADWTHTKQSAPFMPYCHKIVSVGRVKWIPDSKMTGKDNCAWYLFKKQAGKTEFISR